MRLVKNYFHLENKAVYNTAAKRKPDQTLPINLYFTIHYYL